MKKLTFRFMVIFLISSNVFGTILCMETKNQKTLKIKKIMLRYKERKVLKKLEVLKKEIEYDEFNESLAAIKNGFRCVVKTKEVQLLRTQKECINLKNRINYIKKKQNPVRIETFIKKFKAITNQQLQRKRKAERKDYKIRIENELRAKIYKEQEAQKEEDARDEAARINADNIKRLLQMRQKLIRENMYTTIALVCSMFFLYFVILT